MRYSKQQHRRRARAKRARYNAGASGGLGWLGKLLRDFQRLRAASRDLRLHE